MEFINQSTATNGTLNDSERRAEMGIRVDLERRKESRNRYKRLLETLNYDS